MAGMQVMRTLPGRISGILKMKGRAESLCDDDGAPGKLVALRKALGPLLAEHHAAEAPEKGTMSIGRGVEYPHFILARQYWKRFFDHLEGYRALAPFLKHVRDCVPRGGAERGRIRYVPPGGARFQPYWLTE